MKPLRQVSVSFNSVASKLKSMLSTKFNNGQFLFLLLFFALALIFYSWWINKQKLIEGGQKVAVYENKLADMTNQIALAQAELVEVKSEDQYVLNVILAQKDRPYLLVWSEMPL